MYEAYVLFEFFKYLTDCVDGEENFAEKLEYIPQMKYVSPLCCFHIKPGRIFLFRCKQMILQYVYVKIGLTIATFVLELVHLYDEGNFAYNRGYLWTTLVYNISIFLSLYFLVLFYEGSKEILAEFKPLPKFLCIKAVIFFAFWQSVVIAILVKFNFLISARPGYSSGDISALVNNALICIEMFPIAVAFSLTFSWDPFKDPSRIPRPANPGMFVNVLKNFGQIANFRDIVLDTKASLKKEPVRRILTEDFFDIPQEEQKSRIILEGSIKKCGEDLAKIWKMRHVALVSKPAGIMYWGKNPWTIAPGAKIPKVHGFVAFKNIESVVPKRDTGLNVVLKTTRVWRFRCANSAERDFWINRITAFLPKADDKETVTLEGAESVPVIEEDDDENETQIEMGTMRPNPAAGVPVDYDSDSDDDSDDTRLPNDRVGLSDSLDTAERQRPPPPPPRPAGVLNFLNRGVQRISAAVSSTMAPPPKPPRGDRKPHSPSTEYDALEGARSTAIDDLHHAHNNDSEDEVSIAF